MVAVLVPIVLGIYRGIGVLPSRVLMPLSFATEMGGRKTLVGTSTNLLVAGLAVASLGRQFFGASSTVARSDNSAVSAD